MEQTSVTLTLDVSLPSKLHELESEGWEIMPGNPPKVTYHLVRDPKRAKPAIGGLGKFAIDETKIHVIRDGKVVG